MATAIRGMPGSEFEPRRPLQKEYPIRQDGVFFLECAAAPENSLPRPARSASNQEVRQGSCEWRQPFVGCREASSSLVARSKNTTLSGGVFSCAPRRSPSCQPAAGGYRSRQPGHFLESASLHPPQAALRRFPRRPLQKHHPIGWCFFVCASALTVVSAGCRRLPQPTAGTLPRKRLASSAAGGASALSSSPAPKTPPYRVVFFCVRLSTQRRVSRLPTATFFSLLRHISRSHDKEMGEADEI